MAGFMKDYLERVAAADWTGAGEYYADDIVAHQGGRSKWAGTYHGKQEFLTLLGEMTGSLDSLEIEHHALTEGDGHAVVLNSLTGTIGDKSHTGNRAVVYHISDDKITELWIIDQDQAAMDEFLA